MRCPCTKDCCALPQPYEPEHVCEESDRECDEYEPLTCAKCGMECLCTLPREVSPPVKDNALPSADPQPEWPALNRNGPSPLRTRDAISIRPQTSTRMKR